MKQFILSTLFLLAVSVIGQAQDSLEITKFTEVDLKIRDTWIRGSDAFDIADEVTADYDTEEQKVRAIFIWITDNIEFSLETVDEQKKNRSKRRVRSKDADEKAALIQELRDDDLKKCLKRRGGVVADYAYLFQQMCEAVGIEAGEIKGYVRKSERRIGQMPRRPDHTWNWAKIDGKKYLFDASMGSGFVEKNKETKQKEFVKKYNDLYFMTPPSVFILNHLPVDDKNQFLETIKTKEEFANQPFVLNGYINSKIEDFEPKNGLIPFDAKTVTFKFKFKDNEIPHRILLYERRKLAEQDFQRDGDYFVLEYKIPENRPRMIKIVIKGSKLYEHEALIYMMANE